jgi:3-hexulose-6-phosphate synthase
MELQIALDRIPAEAALECTARIAGLVDWIEVGTSLIKQYGVALLREVVAAAGTTPVLADLKTADDARWEFSLAYGAGARSATVLGLAPAATVDAAIAVAAEQHREVVIDLMGLEPSARAALAARVPPEVVLAAHVSKDLQRSGHSPLADLGAWAAGRRIAVAGGLGAADLAPLAGTAVRVIIGSAVTGSADPVAAVHALREAAGLPTTTGATR